MIECTQSEWTDIGHGVVIQERRMDGVLAHVAYRHPRPNGGGECAGSIALKPVWRDGWDLLSESPLTVAPSLLCRACGHHGFLRDGRWVPA